MMTGSRNVESPHKYLNLRTFVFVSLFFILLVLLALLVYSLYKNGTHETNEHILEFPEITGQNRDNNNKETTIDITQFFLYFAIVVFVVGVLYTGFYLLKLHLKIQGENSDLLTEQREYEDYILTIVKQIYGDYIDEKITEFLEKEKIPVKVLTIFQKEKLETFFANLTGGYEDLEKEGDEIWHNMDAKKMISVNLSRNLIDMYIKNPNDPKIPKLAAYDLGPMENDYMIRERLEMPNLEKLEAKIVQEKYGAVYEPNVYANILYQYEHSTDEAKEDIDKKKEDYMEIHKLDNEVNLKSLIRHFSLKPKTKDNLALLLTSYELLPKPR